MNVKLPPLPEPSPRFAVEVSATGQRIDYTADQLRAYGQAAYRQALEDAAKVCDEKGFDGIGCRHCLEAATAIRALKEKIDGDLG